MTYKGQVHVGGPPDVHELAGLIVTKVAVGPQAANSYLLRCRLTGEQLLVDAAGDAPTLIRLVNGSLAAVLTTHRHADHHGALAELVAATGARTLAGEGDAGALPVPTDAPLRDGDTVELGHCSFRVIGLPGHTPGAVALLYDDPKGHPHLFTGDCLFSPGGARSPHPDDDPDRLRAEVAARVFAALPDETWVYPGHGHDTTLGEERPRFGAEAPAGA
jgi:glyoxylase-like metal-dependent hydrolase (beta-lactamase superfamily II)